MKIPLEDTFADVLNKAAHGFGLNQTALSRRTGLDPDRIGAVLSGQYEPGVARVLAEMLKLDSASLRRLALGESYPEPVDLKGLVAFNTPCPTPSYPEMTVNSYLVYDPTSREAALFDAGLTLDQLQPILEEKRLRLSGVFLTHTHGDHVQGLEEIRGRFPEAAVYSPAREALRGTTALEAGFRKPLGYLFLEAVSTPGHSPGGTTYILSGLGPLVAVVGDALFCCSQGGAAGNYQKAMEANRKEIFSLPEETILCPGHGPMSRVGWEKLNNPFYSGSL